jgi:hypothetical protein
MNEATGANGLRMFYNGNTATFTSTYASPSASNSTATLQLGAVGSAQIPLLNTARIAATLMWSGRELTLAEFTAFYQATRHRFGV